MPVPNTNSELLSDIALWITTNGIRAITGQQLNDILVGVCNLRAQAITAAFKTLTYSTTLTYTNDPLNPNATVTLTGNTTITLNGTNSGDTGLLRIVKTAGTEAVTFPGVLKGQLQTTAGAIDLVSWINDNGTLRWFVRGASGSGVWGAITGTITNQTDLQNALALLAPLASPTFTGTPILPVGFKIGTIVITATGTEFNYVSGVTSSIQTQLNLLAPLAGPALTGTPTAPTAAAGTNTTQLATTGFVFAERSNTLTYTNKRITSRIGTVASSATPTPDGDNNDMFTVTALAVAATFAAPTGTPTDGQSLLIRIKDNATARALSWNAIYRASTDIALPTTTIVSKTMYLQFVYNAADSKWDFTGLTNGF